MDLVKFTYEYTGHYKIGTMNYHPHGKTINWREFGHNIKRLMDNRGIKYYFKQDLLKEMGISPDKFKQTWICH